MTGAEGTAWPEKGAGSSFLTAAPGSSACGLLASALAFAAHTRIWSISHTAAQRQGPVYALRCY